jgi:hypothetical protein
VQITSNMQEGASIDETMSALKASPRDKTKELTKNRLESEVNTKSSDEEYSRTKSFKRQAYVECVVWLVATLVGSFLWARPSVR